jgi:hypothetical protein
MKISKNELRKMIFETVLREQEGNVQGAGTGAKKTNTPDKEEAGRLKSNIENKVKQIVSKVAGNDSFSGMITIGKKRTEVTRAEPKELGQKIERALESDKDLKDYKESLKVGRAFKITVNKGKNDAPAAEVVDTPEEPESRKAQAYGPISNEDPYIYRVNTETGCWETKKKDGGGNWISLRNNEKATDVLDGHYPKARTDEDKKKCKPNAAKGGSKPAAKANDENDTALTVTIKNLNNALSGFTLSNVGRLSTESTKYKAFEIKQDIVTISDIIEAISGGRGTYLNMNENQKLAYIFLKLDDKNQVSSLAICSASSKGLNGMYFNSAGQWTRKLITNEQVKFENGKKNSALADGSNWIPDILNALDEIKSGTNESKDTYGKSHGTLIRERYWGRY